MISKTTVLINGAGPTGLTFAVELARCNIPFRIIDQRDQVSHYSQGMQLHARTLEIFYNLDMINIISDHGFIVPYYNFLMDGKPQGKIQFEKIINSPFPYTLTLNKGSLEVILENKLKGYGYQVEWGKSFKGLKEERDHVKVKTSSGQEIIEAQWLVSCDGAKSPVRRLLNIPMMLGKNEETYIVCDAEIEWPYEYQEAYAFLNDQEIITVSPMKNQRHRLQYYSVNYLIPKEAPTEKDTFQILVNRLISQSCQLKSVKGLQVYHQKRGVAARMRHKRIFLLGDAAHVQAPIGGHGLNSGIVDAHNLAWKLNLYTKGKATASFLNSFEEERLLVAQHLHTQSDLTLSLLTSQSTGFQKFKKAASYLFPKIPFVQDYLPSLLWDVPVNYHASSISSREKSIQKHIVKSTKSWFYGHQSQGEHVIDSPLHIPGTYERTRILDLIKDPQHTLLLFLGDHSQQMDAYYQLIVKLNQDLKELLKCYLIVGEHAIDYNAIDQNLNNIYLDGDGKAHKSYGCYEPTLYLIRPDGYIAWLSTPPCPKSLWDYLQKHYKGFEKGFNGLQYTQLKSMNFVKA